jgi:hypothetical protein
MCEIIALSITITLSNKISLSKVNYTAIIHSLEGMIRFSFKLVESKDEHQSTGHTRQILPYSCAKLKREAMTGDSKL